MSDEPKTPQQEPKKPPEGPTDPAAGSQPSGQTGGFNEFGIPLDDSVGNADPSAAKEGETSPSETSAPPGNAPSEEGPRKILDELDKASSQESPPSPGGENDSAVPPVPSKEPPPEPPLEGEPLITDAMRRLDDMLERLRRRRDAA